MVFMTNIRLMDELGDAIVVGAMAAGFAVPAETVVVVAENGPLSIGDAWDLPGLRVIVERTNVRLDEPDTVWVVDLAITAEVEPPTDELALLKIFAAELGVPLVGAIPEDAHADAFRLVFPDGHAPVRYWFDELELTDDDWSWMAAFGVAMPDPEASVAREWTRTWE